MKKLVLTLIVALAYCGSIFAQDLYETHWPDFSYGPYPMQAPFVAALQIDGNIVSVENNPDNWNALEVAAYILDGNGEKEYRANGMWLTDEYQLEYDDPYLTIDGYPIFYKFEEVGQNIPVYFEMWDHVNNVGYTNFTLTTIDGEPFTTYLAEWVTQGWDDPASPLMLNFIPDAGIDLAITGYGEGNEGGYYLISSPIGGGFAASTVNNLINDEQIYDFYAFDQVGDDEGKEWINLRGNGDYVFEFGAGYLYANKNGVTLTFRGTAYEGDGAVELTYADGDFAGLNLIGNPYNANAFLDREYYVLNEDAATINNIPVGVDVEIAPMNGVFVVATEAGQFANFVPASKGELKLSRLALNLTNSRGLVDRAVVNFGQGRQLPKMQLNNSTKLYIPMDGQDYAVVSSDGMGEMPVNFKAETSGSYTISFSTLAVDFSYLHLIDNLNGNDVDLLVNPSYSFDASVTDYTSRFKLVFVTSDSSNSDNFAFFSNGSFIINNEGEATLQVVDVAGRILSSETISGCANVNVNAAPGVYMIRLINGDNTRVQKVVVK